MRHYKVNCKINNFNTADSFNQNCKNYDNSEIMPGKSFSFDVVNVYTSNLSRAIKTAQFQDFSCKIISTPLLNEVPTRSFINRNIKLPTILWYLISRLQWLIGFGNQLEYSLETLNRINEFLNSIEDKKEDTLIVGHGFYFFIMRSILKKRGYIGRCPISFKNGEVAKFILNTNR